MASIPKVFFRGSASTGSTTLYTVPSATTAIITEIAACNTSSSTQTATVFLNGVEIIEAATIAADTTLVVPLKQPLSATQVIAGLASATSVRFHISGVEVS